MLHFKYYILYLRNTTHCVVDSKQYISEKGCSNI